MCTYKKSKMADVTVCVIVTLLCLWGCATATPMGDTPVTPKTYTINLDEPPETRWNQVLLDFKYMVPELTKTVETLVPPAIIPLAEQIGAQLDNSIPQPFADEIRGAAKVFGLPLGEMVLLNIIYDITAVRCPVIGHPTDQLTFRQYLLKMTVYTATTYAGYVGIVTGQKPGLFSISVDQRGHKVHVGTYWQNLLIAILDKRSQFVSFLVREVLENVTSFDEAVRQLSYRIIHAPVYYIVGGVKEGEGVVITRDRLAAIDEWYIEPRFGKTPGYKAMDKMGQAGLNFTSLFEVMSTDPVMNINTTYTVLMNAGKPGLYTTWVRWPKPPQS